MSLGPCYFYFSLTTCQNEIKCNIQLFADDAKIFKTVKNEEDHQDLAKDLDNLENWARLWQMRFLTWGHVKCCTSVEETHARYEYSMGNLTLETATEEKDLGVIIHEYANRLKKRALPSHFHIVEREGT